MKKDQQIREQQEIAIQSKSPYADKLYNQDNRGKWQ